MLAVYEGKIDQLKKKLSSKSLSEEKKREIIEIIQDYYRLSAWNESRKRDTVQALNYSVVVGISLNQYLNKWFLCELLWLWDAWKIRPISGVLGLRCDAFLIHCYSRVLRMPCGWYSNRTSWGGGRCQGQELNMSNYVLLHRSLESSLRDFPNLVLLALWRRDK